MKVKILLVLVLVAGLAVLLVQNAAVVTYRLFFWTISLSQVILIPLLAVVGFVIGYVVGTMGRKRS